MTTITPTGPWCGRTHTHTHSRSQLAVSDLDEIDLAAGQIIVLAVHPAIINTRLTEISFVKPFLAAITPLVHSHSPETPEARSPALLHKRLRLRPPDCKMTRTA